MSGVTYFTSQSNLTAIKTAQCSSEPQLRFTATSFMIVIVSGVISLIYRHLKIFLALGPDSLTMFKNKKTKITEV